MHSCQQAGFPSLARSFIRVSRFHTKIAAFSLTARRSGGWKDARYQTPQRLCGWLLAKDRIDEHDRSTHTHKPSVHLFQEPTNKHTHTRHATSKNQPAGIQPSPTAPLNVKKRSSGERGGKGQPMVMPRLTLKCNKQKPDVD